jgi:uncharacterized protein DUF4398
MRSMVSHFPRALAVAAVFALGAAGCATSPPPTDQMTVAKASVSDANTAGAAVYAPNELKLANDKLANAQKAMADRDYGLALRSAQQAQADAQLAVARTQAMKARKATDDAQAAARTLREETDRNALRAAPGGTQ